MKKLLQGCKNLDRKSQREMVNHLSPFLYAVCRRYSDSHEDTKDLLQESLILIFNNIEKCQSDEEAPFKSWCRRIAVNTALSKKRKKHIPTGTMENSKLAEAVHPNIYSRLNVEDILQLLQYLPENQRLAFNLAIVDGYSHREIAELLNVKESSSRTFLTRARQSLQQMIYQQEID